MTQVEWLNCNEPQRMVNYLLSRVSNRKLRLFGCECCKRLLPLIEITASLSAIEVAERFAEGTASQIELETAEAEARTALLQGRRLPRRFTRQTKAWREAQIKHRLTRAAFRTASSGSLQLD
jgi:hypothetical protein